MSDIADKEFRPTIWEFYEKTLKPMEILKNRHKNFTFFNNDDENRN